MEKQGRSGILFRCFKEHTKIGLDICAGTCYNIVRKCGHRTSASISAFQAEEVGSIPIARSTSKNVLPLIGRLFFYHFKKKNAFPEQFPPFSFHPPDLYTGCFQKAVYKSSFFHKAQPFSTVIPTLSISICPRGQGLKVFHKLLGITVKSCG